ncbi:hypothetical protein TIFTF001_051679 [Ficus carica]|uniref:TF-B3 domain-containing protein n=1 Tax=Ficus carica TaxID=3494 RepID=A0AA87Z4L1_FICCA|nr:hypothetical protein TIFTF001_051679 [Ficus carica]
MAQANVGVYEKVLSATDIAQKMSVPIHWVEGERRLLPTPIPGVPVVLPVRDQKGNDTTLRLARSQREPYFMSKEWRALVDAYDLKKGDRVYFWWEGNFLRVKVRTSPYKIMLFGVCIGVRING